jgi:peptide/nickel transport system substrate-binding protein
MDPVKRAALFIRLNDLVIQNVVVIPVLWRNVVSAVSVRLRGTDVTTWDLSTWNLASWYRV